MDKNSAINLIDKTFNNAFDEAQFTNFIQNLLNDFEIKPNKYSGNTIWEDQRDHVGYYKRIGKYIDPEGEALDVLIVQVKNVSKLERARTALRNFVIKHLNNFEKDYALVAFYSKEDDGFDWRFSFIKMEHQSYLDEEKQKVKMRKEFTPAKRYSFLVGKYEKSHTAKTQLLPLLQNIANNPTISELEKAFSIERVTDEFFEQYKSLYIKVYEYFEKQDLSIFQDSQLDASGFTKKLLGQIVFLYFLQKKGWLGVPKNERWGNGDKHFVQKLFEKAQQENLNFFKDYLQYLFYEALAKERDNDNSFYPRFNCRIPFLNGGLFEAQYDWQNANISIPQDFFRSGEEKEEKRTGILDVFDRYNFTIKEDEPLDKEVAVDPEMLGKVFENMLEIKERKSKGAFYTPREIVHYMCQESLIHYLDNALNNYNNTYQELGDDQTNMFGNQGKTGQQTIQAETNEIIVPKEDIEQYIREGHLALENDVRVAERGETKTYKFLLPETVRNNADVIDKKLTEIRICDPAIGSGAFPVGLLHELVTAQLILKPHLSYNYLKEKLLKFELIESEPALSEVEVSESRYVYRLKKHIIQESIYGVDIDRSAIDIARLRLWLSLVVDEDDLEPIETLPNLDYKIVCGNSLIGMPDGTMRDLEVEKELETLKEEFYAVTNEQRKKTLRNKINTKIRELLDTAETFAGYKIDFDFKLFFSEVWREKGGFDVVIGNPPYGEIIKTNKDFFKNNFISAEGKYEIYKFFIEKSCTIINNVGCLTFITPDTWTSLSYFKKLRKHIISDYHLYLITETLYDVFKSATVDTTVFIISNQNINPKTLLVSGDIKLSQSIELNYLKNDYSIILKPRNEIVIEIEKQKNRLDDVCEVWQGLIAYGSKKQPREWSSNEKETEFHKKLLYGGDINMFKINWAGEYLKYGDWLHRPRPEYIYAKPHILVQRIRNPRLKQRIKAAIDRDFHINGTGTSNILLKENCNLKLEEVLCYINSNVINYWFSYYFFDVNIKPEQLRQIPLPSESIEQLVVLTHYLEFTQEAFDNLYDFYFILCNSIIFEVYFPDKIESANKSILKHFSDLKPINDSMSEEEKLGIIQSEYERLYHPDHPVRFAIETLDSIEEVRIIREALK
ncbi:Eco57I restriction-modification methylase domain-containing protein [Mesoflavibacter sp. CH_XMU1404-2]|uniref:Eco57I restriction-modification methylase domain-containing protein n=1 Tax=Mesoflavibacter sp. CH_XMU1404-2 TaxID=3107766 RepID=UPI00300AA199